VVLVARTAAELDDVAAGIRARGGVAEPIACDVTDLAAIEGALAGTIREHGRLDIVVANAGAFKADTPANVLDDFDRVVDINLSSVHALARLAEPHLRVRGGKFLVTGSGAGRRPFPGNVAYSVSKAAVSMLVRCLAVEWRPAAIAVNEIVPGPVRTAMNTEAGMHVATAPAGSVPDALRLDWHKVPDDLTPLALFLAGQPNNGPSGQTFSLLGRDG
jgi:3-oxoacyl-[acyl-carrier protein] reductase